jgi:hypothetical protein
MTVKAAVGEIGRLHNVGDADAAESFAAEQRASRVDDPFTMFGDLLAAHAHCAPQLCVRLGDLTNYMMTIINAQDKDDAHHLTAI